MPEPTHEAVQAILNQHLLSVGLAYDAMQQAVFPALGKYVQVKGDEIQYPDGTAGVDAKGIYTLPNGEKGVVQLNHATLMDIYNGTPPTWTVLPAPSEETP